MVLALGVALGAVEPFLAARTADRDLGVQDVFAMAFYALEISLGGGRGRGEREEGERTTWLL